jgi:hypothetical protein
MKWRFAGLRARLSALAALREAGGNVFETAWLDHAMRQAGSALREADGPAR